MSKALFHRLTRITRSITIAGCLAGSAQAHDFWLQPDDFTPEKPGNISIAARIGHADDIANWPIEQRLIAAAYAVGPDGTKSLLNPDLFDEQKPNLSTSLAEAGTHIVSFLSMPAYSALPAEKFNQYLDEEGIRPIVLDRAARRTQGQAGKERYARRAKALVHFGEAGRNDSHVTQPLGHSLEIVPLENPYALSVDEEFPVEVLYYGQPIVGITIHVARIEPSHEDVTTLTTDKLGRASISLTQHGAYMMHVGWSSPMPPNIDDRADYDTLFASLTFEWGGSEGS